MAMDAGCSSRFSSAGLLHKGRAEMARRLEETIHGRDDHVLILDLGPADKIEPRVESLGKTFETVKRTAVVI
jgi:CRISPR-associated protein Cas2